MRAKIANARSRSRGVVLDAGLQYPPARVFSLPGGTRFLDQFGDVYIGPAGSGNNIANAVTNPAVRAAEADYLRALSALIPGDLLGAVRTGGGPQGQLSYPTGKYQGHQDAFWAYDSSTSSPSATSTNTICHASMISSVRAKPPAAIRDRPCAAPGSGSRFAVLASDSAAHHLGRPFRGAEPAGLASSPAVKGGFGIAERLEC